MRRFAAAMVLAGCGIGAHAQTEVHQPSPAQALACLVRPEQPPRFPKQDKLDKGWGGMRVLLKFKRPDDAPEVEVLFNSAREDMQDAVHRYLSGYRLPCLAPKDGIVSAVQEFSFSNADRDISPVPPEPKNGEQPFCLVAPREDMRGITLYAGRLTVQHVVVDASFTGNGDQPPELKVVYATEKGPFEKAVRERLAGYRMPCRKAGWEPQHFRQTFTMVPQGDARYSLKRQTFTLAEFLGMTREPAKLRANYDFKTMGCPFKVRYTLFGGGMPNEAVVAGPKDPNKLPFLNWLAGLQLAVDEDTANGLFGSMLEINVGCGALKLGRED